MDLARQALLGGFALALLAGLTALAAPKGHALHLAAGRAFTRLLVALTLVTLPFAWAEGDLFVVLIASFGAYLAHAGRREIVRHRSGAGPTLADRAPLALLVVVAIALVVAAVRRDDAPVGTVPVTVGFASLLVFVAVSEGRRLARPAEARGWLLQHVGAMGVSVVTLATGVGAVTYDAWGLPAWVPWLAPTAIGLVAVPRWLARVRQDGERATFL